MGYGPKTKRQETFSQRGLLRWSVFVYGPVRIAFRGLATDSKMKPTSTAKPRNLPNGKPDQSNVVFSDDANRWVMAAIGRNLSAFAKR